VLGVTKNAPNKHTPGYNEASSGISTPGVPYTESKRNLARQGRDEILRTKMVNSHAMSVLPKVKAGKGKKMLV